MQARNKEINMQVGKLSNTSNFGAGFAPTTKKISDTLYMAAKTGTLEQVANEMLLKYPSQAKLIRKLMTPQLQNLEKGAKLSVIA